MACPLFRRILFFCDGCGIGGVLLLGGLGAEVETDNHGVDCQELLGHYARGGQGAKYTGKRQGNNRFDIDQFCEPFQNGFHNIPPMILHPIGSHGYKFHQ